MEPLLEPDLERLNWAQLVYDADSDLTVVAGEDGSVWVYDLEANTWTKKGRSPLRDWFRLVYGSASGLVVAQVLGDTTTMLWTYDVETDTWTPLPQVAPPQLYSDFDREVLAYDASVDRIVAYKANRTWLLDPRTGTWSESQVLAAPQLNPGYIGAAYAMAYDEAMGQTVVFSDGQVVAYDAAADRWETLDLRPVSHGQHGPAYRLYHSMVYDSLNERLVILGGWYRTDATGNAGVAGDDVLAFDPATRTWTDLLAPSTPYAQGTN
jgi:phage baseplate assembly protein gpV